MLQTMIGTWEKTGNFNQKIVNRDVRRLVIYQNQDPNGRIERIRLLGYENGDLRIGIDIKKPYPTANENQKLYETVMQPIVERGFSFTDCYLFNYFLSFPNVGVLSSLLLALRADVPENLAVEIVETIKPYSKEEPVIPGWIRTGSFETPYDIMPGGIKYSEDYTSTYPTSNIRHMTLTGYADEMPNLSVEISKAYYDIVMAKLFVVGFPHPSASDTAQNYYTLNVNSEYILEKFLNILSQVEVSLQSVEVQIRKSLLDEMHRQYRNKVKVGKNVMGMFAQQLSADEMLKSEFDKVMINAACR